MSLISKFKKHVDVLTQTVDGTVALDFKNPKLYKKIKRFYQEEVLLDGEDPDRDYNLIIECIRQDLESAEVS